MKHIYLLLTILLLVFVACDKEEQEAVVPAYLKIDDISVNTTSPNQGTANDRIVDAWVFVNDQLIGAFELPASIPILNTGQTNIKIRGGILNNGLSNQREIYPFYEFYVLDTILEPEQEYQPEIAVEYRSTTQFNQAWSREDFESGIKFEANPNSDTSIVRVSQPDQVFEGNASGAAFLPAGKDFFEVYSPTFSNVPRNGTDVYMEMNYKSTHDFAISIYTNNRSQQFSIVNLRARADWNKVYIELGPVFSTLFNASNFNIAIGLIKPVNEEGLLLLDNLKLLTF